MTRPKLPFAQAAQRMLNDIEQLNLDVDPSDLAAIQRAASGELPPFMRTTALQADVRPEWFDARGEEVHEVPFTSPSVTSPATASSLDEVPAPTPAVTIAVGEEVQREVAREVPGSQQEVSPPESARTSSPSFKKSKTRCGAQKKDSGASCRAWAIPQTGFCVFHDPGYAETLRDMQARGGRSPRHVLVGEAKKIDVDLMDRGAIQALIGQALRFQLLGAISPRQASAITKLLALLVSNARDMPNSEDDAAAYAANNRALISITDLIAERLDGRDLNDRTNAIADFGAKRQEYLRANEKFAPHAPPYPSVRDYPR